MSTIAIPAAPEAAPRDVSADPDAGNCDSGRPNWGGYAWKQPYVCACGSVSSFPCNCGRSGSGRAA